VADRFVVIAQSPSVDVSQVAGPFRSRGVANAAAGRLDDKGYVTEVAELVSMREIDYSPAWDGESGG
jgi:hypothetical protein